MSFLYLFLLIASAVAEDRHALVYKSPTTISAECQQYLGFPTTHPSQPHVPCQAACGALIGRIWDNHLTETRSVTTSRYIDSDLVPEQYFNRLNHCLDQVRQTYSRWDTCRRGDASFACYNQTVSSIHFDRSFFIPKTDLQHRQVLQDCIDFHQITNLEQILKQDLTNHPDGRRLLRCVLIREKLYSEANGLAPYRVTIQLGDNRHHHRFREDLRQCAGRLQREFLDRPTLAARIATECFGNLVGQLRSLLSHGSQQTVGSVHQLPERNVTVGSYY